MILSNLTSLLVGLAYASSFGDLYGLRESVENATCEVLLATHAADDLPGVIERVRNFRRQTLGVNEVEPAVKRNFVSTEANTAGAQQALAAHLRGVEVWGLKAHGEGEGTPRIAAVTFRGPEEIAWYFERLNQLRARLPLTMPDNARQSLPALFKGLNLLAVMMPTLLLASAYLQPAVMPLFCATSTLGLAAGYEANQHRVIKDRCRSRTSDHLQRALATGQTEGWMYASRSYRLNQLLVNSMWKKDAVSTGAGVYLSHTPLLTRATTGVYNGLARAGLVAGEAIPSELRSDASVVVDHFLTFEDDHTPMLSVIVRTSTNSPSKQLQAFRGAAIRPVDVRTAPATTLTR